jgi:hypothetical protein
LGVSLFAYSVVCHAPLPQSFSNNWQQKKKKKIQCLNEEEQRACGKRRQGCHQPHRLFEPPRQKFADKLAP